MATSQLDPKLQEIYNRVMGTATDAPAPAIDPVPASPQIPTTPPVPASNPAPVVAPAAPLTPMEPLPAATPVTPPISQPQPKAEDAKQEMTTVESTTTVKSHAFVAKSNDKKVSPVILAVGAIAFLLVYTVVWIKVFNLSVPFINQ